MKSLVGISFMVVLLVCMFPGESKGNHQYKRVLPYLDDGVVSTLIERDMAPYETLMEEDKIKEWLSIASDTKQAVKPRVYAIKRLFDYRQKRIEQGLIPLLIDSSMEVREESARVLGRMKFPSSAVKLIHSLRFSYGNTRIEIRKALKNITGQDFGNNYYTWRKWYLRNRREYR